MRFSGRIRPIRLNPGIHPGKYARSHDMIKPALLPQKTFLALAAACFVALMPAASASTATINDTARVLAGLPPSQESPLHAVASGEAWSNHAGKFSGVWNRFEERQLSHARKWANRELGEAGKNAPVLYYAFSGPDIVYGNTFFPDCKTYVLCGLEPAGQVPDLLAIPPGKVGEALHHLLSSMRNVLSLGFFITKDMGSDLRNASIPGTTPVLLSLLARMGKTVRDATPVSLDHAGNEVPRGAANAAAIPGIKIVFDSGPNTPAQTLYYFCADISNGGLAKNQGFANFCNKLPAGAGLVKAASYLMHGGEFSGIRKLLLDRCKFILQDDTGIPASVLSELNWHIRPYGIYKGPIGMFRGFYQKKLEQIFSSGKQAPLDFGVGYYYRTSECNMILASREAGAPKPEAAGRPAPAPAPTPEKSPARVAREPAPPATIPPAGEMPPKKAMAALEDEELRIRADSSLSREERNQKLHDVWNKQLAVMGKLPKK